MAKFHEDALDQLRAINTELQLTDAIDALASAHGARGVELTQRRIDCGSPTGFLEAQLSIGAVPGSGEAGQRPSPRARHEPPRATGGETCRHEPKPALQ